MFAEASVKRPETFLRWPVWISLCMVAMARPPPAEPPMSRMRSGLAWRSRAWVWACGGRGVFVNWIFILGCHGNAAIEEEEGVDKG